MLLDPGEGAESDLAHAVCGALEALLGEGAVFGGLHELGHDVVQLFNLRRHHEDCVMTKLDLTRVGRIEIQVQSNLDQDKFFVLCLVLRTSFWVSSIQKIVFYYTKDTFLWFFRYGTCILVLVRRSTFCGSVPPLGFEQATGRDANLSSKYDILKHMDAKSKSYTVS